jgi:hypothetical protein
VDTDLRELRLEHTRLTAQIKALRLRASELEMDADRLGVALARFEQDNLPTNPCNRIPDPPV